MAGSVGVMVSVKDSSGSRGSSSSTMDVLLKQNSRALAGMVKDEGI